MSDPHPQACEHKLADEARELIACACEMVDAINRYNNRNPVPVGTSHLAQIRRFLATQPSTWDLELFLKMLPGSPITEYGATAEQQTRCVVQATQVAMKRIQRKLGDDDLPRRLAHVVGWAQRLINEVAVDPRRNAAGGGRGGGGGPRGGRR